MIENFRSSQEQAVAAWVNYLNQLRIDDLMQSLSQQNVNLDKALATVNTALQEIRQVVNSGLGSEKGMHGFIAEVAQTGVGNARSHIMGEEAIYRRVNDNGPVDLFRGNIPVQLKFYQSGNRFGLGAIRQHLEKYPSYVRNGGLYQLPKDHYQVVRTLHNMPQAEAAKFLSRAGDGPSYRDWEQVQEFFKDGSIPFESLEASHLKYSEVQRDAYEATVSAEKDSLRKTDQERRDFAFQQSKPSLKQATKVTATAAVTEGGMAFLSAMYAKRRGGTKLKHFTGEDWKEIARASGIGFGKGGVRGISIYTLTNFTATPAAVASAIATSGFAIADQANALRRGEITEQQFIENSELVTLETAVSALSSFIGEAIIPVPILGSVIGNTVGMTMYRSVASFLSAYEARLIEQYLEEQCHLEEHLAAEYQELIDQLDAAMSDYIELLDRAFAPDIETALEGSVSLAISLGVTASEILDTKEKTHSFFLD